MKILSILFILFVLSSCNKEASLECESATIVNAIGPDFCGDYAIRTAENEFFYPVNLESEYKTDSLSVCLNYKILEDSFQNCGFAGSVQVIEIKEIRRTE